MTLSPTLVNPGSEPTLLPRVSVGDTINAAGGDIFVVKDFVGGSLIFPTLGMHSTSKFLDDREMQIGKDEFDSKSTLVEIAGGTKTSMQANKNSYREIWNDCSDSSFLFLRFHFQSGNLLGVSDSV